MRLIQLLECPFCRRSNLKVLRNDMDHQVRCQTCFAQGPSSREMMDFSTKSVDDSYNDAIIKWNRALRFPNDSNLTPDPNPKVKNEPA